MARAGGRESGQSNKFGGVDMTPVATPSRFVQLKDELTASSSHFPSLLWYSEVAKTSSPSTIRIASEPQQNPSWLSAFDAMACLQRGWNGYDAPPPNEAAVEIARRLALALNEYYKAPSRTAPSVVGGVGLTIRSKSAKAYIEVYNDKAVYWMYSDGESEPEVHRVDIFDDLEQQRLIEEVRVRLGE